MTWLPSRIIAGYNLFHQTPTETFAIKMNEILKYFKIKTEMAEEPLSMNMYQFRKQLFSFTESTYEILDAGMTNTADNKRYQVTEIKRKAFQLN